MTFANNSLNNGSQIDPQDKWGGFLGIIVAFHGGGGGVSRVIL